MALYQFELLDSTNGYMKEHRESFQEYDVVVAKNQSSGKGRRGNIWISREGMALFTFLVKEKEGKKEEDYMKLPLLVGLATIRALETIKNANYQFKWTNDIYVQGKKLGGILIERREKDFFVGIGINVNNKIPSEIENIAISLQNLEEKNYRIETIILSILQKFQIIWEEYWKGNWETLLEEINERNYLKGQRLALRAGNLFVQGMVGNINLDGEIEIDTGKTIESFGIGEIIRERLVFPLEAKAESFAKAYILKEASYDVIVCLQGDFSEEWEEKLKRLSVKIERNLSLEEAVQKYHAKKIQDFSIIFPLKNYSEEKIQEIAKTFV